MTSQIEKTSKTVIGSIGPSALVLQLTKVLYSDGSIRPWEFSPHLDSFCCPSAERFYGGNDATQESLVRRVRR